MRFWDSSAVVPLLWRERSSRAVGRLYAMDPAIATWWTTEGECVSAIRRLVRTRELQGGQVDIALARLDRLRKLWHEVPPTAAVREHALRVLEFHDLSAADSLQLAAALVVAENRPESIDFVGLDKRLMAAASSEGFRIVPVAPTKP